MATGSRVHTNNYGRARILESYAKFKELVCVRTVTRDTGMFYSLCDFRRGDRYEAVSPLRNTSLSRNAYIFYVISETVLFDIHIILGGIKVQMYTGQYKMNPI
jgi:hypothetical protein